MIRHETEDYRACETNQSKNDMKVNENRVDCFRSIKYGAGVVALTSQQIATKGIAMSILRKSAVTATILASVAAAVGPGIKIKNHSPEALSS